MSERTAPIIKPDDPAYRAVAGIASAWSWDEELERLDADRSVLEGLPPARRTALGHYLASRKAAASIGIDVSRPQEDHR